MHKTLVHKESSSYEYALIGLHFVDEPYIKRANVFPTCCRVKMLIVCQKCSPRVPSLTETRNGASFEKDSNM